MRSQPKGAFDEQTHRFSDRDRSGGAVRWLGGARRPDGDPETAVAVPFQRENRQSLAPAAAGNLVHLQGNEGRQAVPRHAHRHASDSLDRRLSVRCRLRQALPERDPRGAHDRLVHTRRQGKRLVLRRGNRAARPSWQGREHGGQLADRRQRRSAGDLPTRRAEGRPDRPAGVLQGPCRGPLPGARRPCPCFRTRRLLQGHGADRGMDSPRAGRARPQVLRPWDRQRPRAEREGAERAERARLRDEDAVVVSGRPDGYRSILSGRRLGVIRSMNVLPAQFTSQTITTTPTYVQKPWTEKFGAIHAASATMPMLITSRKKPSVTMIRGRDRIASTGFRTAFAIPRTAAPTR